jgi:4'-phosphopantetheinyl transferase
VTIVQVPEPQQVHVWWIPLSAIRSADIVSCLDADERMRMHAFKAETHRRRFAATHAARRAILSSYLGIPPAAVVYERSTTGKPSVVDARSIAISCSSREGFAVLAVGGEPLGVDLEHVGDREGDRSLLRAWTRREAHGKLTGVGLTEAADADTMTHVPFQFVELPAPPQYIATLAVGDGERDVRSRFWKEPVSPAGSP